jgi:hypothetical protein
VFAAIPLVIWALSAWLLGLPLLFVLSWGVFELWVWIQTRGRAITALRAERPRRT